MTKYKAIITTVGAAKIAAATAGGTQLKITHMAVGDGNGALPEPMPEQTKLLNEQYRAALNALDIANTSKDHIVAELSIPANVGGFWLREMGLFDESGELIAVGNMAESYKPKLEEGSGRTQTLRMILIVSNTDAIQVIAGDDTVLASRDFVEKALLDHEGSRRHPDATTTAKGFVMLSNATNSPDENKAITPAALKQVNDAGLKKASNLSDVPNKETARRNLQLGSAATKNVGTESGQLMAVGAFGLGGAAINISDANAASKTGFYKLAPGAANTPNPAANWEMLCIKYDAISAKQLFWQAGANTTRTYIRYRTSPSGVWGPFQHYYSTENKPTSADVGAWSKNEADSRYLMKSGGQLTGPLKASAEIQSTEPNNYRSIGGDYGTFWRNDGNSLYLMLTNAKDQYGGFNDMRPLYVNIKNGAVTMGHDVSINGRLNVGPAIHSSDGNIMGSRWGNKWLWDAIIEQVNGRVDWGSFSNRTHEGSGWWRDENTGVLFQYGRTYTNGINESANLWQPFNISFTQWVGPILLTPAWPDRSSWDPYYDYGVQLGSNDNNGFNWNKQQYSSEVRTDWPSGMTWFAIGK
ncbi:Phage tail fiber protein [Serratia rubidaea]|uniref:phage tail-collar fiber domain-containing protein n=1 Tax=Serratia rubidaea TaxID=61652 RepID=UPI00077483E7|nr:phage tail protein [Serratia rubidaea]AML59959.1 Phage tail fiber protein [Serratia rubidaea]